MKARIEIVPEKKIVGKFIRMSLMANKTFELWNGFMVHKKTIPNAIGNNLYSIQVYDNLRHFEKFNPSNEFTKWAGIEVNDLNNIPNGFSNLIIKKGLYAVFVHKGPASKFSETMQYILIDWLPQSEYCLDERPHFELLGEKYKNNDPSSEEEVWIPIKKKLIK